MLQVTMYALLHLLNLLRNCVSYKHICMYAPHIYIHTYTYTGSDTHVHTCTRTLPPPLDRHKFGIIQNAWPGLLRIWLVSADIHSKEETVTIDGHGAKKGREKWRCERPQGYEGEEKKKGGGWKSSGGRMRIEGGEGGEGGEGSGVRASQNGVMYGSVHGLSTRCIWCIYIYVHTHTYIYIYVYMVEGSGCNSIHEMCTLIYTYMYVYIYTCTCTYTYIYTHIYMHVHAHIHT